MTLSKRTIGKHAQKSRDEKKPPCGGLVETLGFRSGGSWGYQREMLLSLCLVRLPIFCDPSENTHVAMQQGGNNG